MDSKNQAGKTSTHPSLAEHLNPTQPQQPIDGKPLALLLPYGSVEKTASLISMGIGQLSNTPTDLIVLISPLRDRQQKVLKLGCKMLTKKTLQTPFGSLDIDHQLAAHIAQHLRLEQSRNEKQFLQDLLPVSQFLIHTFPETKIISIMLGAYELDLAVNLAKFLTNISAKVAPILIAFSKLDKQSLDELEFGNSLRFYSYAKKYHTEYPDLILPFAPIISALEYSNLEGGYNFTPIVEYYDHVSQGGQQIFSTTAMFWHYEPPNLGQTQKKELITLGFDAIREYLSSGTVPRYTPKDEILKRKSGVFVTIRQNSNLRGCIGTLKADQPLYIAVQNMAIAAATSDPRFPPLQPQELSQVSIKIAVLSALQKLEIDQIEVGRHGLLIEHQGRRGVLLPEVPLDRGWDKDTFLAHLCLKAGLEVECLENNPNIYGFTAIEFGSSYIQPN